MSYAGILPYAVVRGEPVLLLGKEVHINGWSGSGLWAPFGGGVDPGESLHAAALREGYEETMGVFGTPRQLAARIRRAGARAARWRHRGGMTLLMPLELDRNLPRHFRNFYLYSRRCRRQECPEGWYEKTHIRWVPLRKLREDDLRLRPEFRRTLPSLRRRLDRVLAPDRSRLRNSS